MKGLLQRFNSIKLNPIFICLIVFFIFNIVMFKTKIQIIGNTIFTIILLVLYCKELIGITKSYKGIVLELNNITNNLKCIVEKIVENKVELRETAYHEVGHLLVTRISDPEIKIEKITIEPTNSVLGCVVCEKNRAKTRTDFLIEIRIALAGMVAEEIFNGEFATGCLLDINKAKELVNDMLDKYGMGSDLIYSPEKLAEESNKILMQEKANAREILEKNIDKLELITETLMAKRTLDEKQIQQIFKELLI